MKLSLDLIPQSCFYKNVRAILTQKQWNIIRKQVYSKAYDVCQVCGASSNQSLEAHEIFEYDDKKLTQTLTNIVALCNLCHSTKHFGLSELMGKRKQVLSHLMKVNNITNKEAEKYIKEQFVIWAERSKKKWKIDVSFLQHEYGVKIKER